MAKGKKVEEEEPAPAEAEPAVEPVAEDVVEEPKAVGDSATVTWRGGSRVYSRKVHGPKFRDLAKEFATKFNGTIV